MSEEYKGLPVSGYRPQSNDKVALVNINKELEERCLRRIEWFEQENTKALVEYNKSYKAIIYPEEDKKLPFTPPYDPRMLKLAFTGIQDAFMWFNRSIFQPSRVSLPEDKPINPSETAFKIMQDIHAGSGLQQVNSVSEMLSKLNESDENE